jgi:hypothetical protein
VIYIYNSSQYKIICGISAIYGENVKSETPVLLEILQKIKSRGDKPAEIKKLDNCILGSNMEILGDLCRFLNPLTLLL